MSDKSGGDISLNTRMTRRQLGKAAALAVGGFVASAACNFFNQTADTVDRAVATVTSPQADKNRNNVCKNANGSTCSENVDSAIRQGQQFIGDRATQITDTANDALKSAETGAKAIGTGADAPVRLVNPNTLNRSSK